MVQWEAYSQSPRQGTSHKKQGNLQCQDKAAVKENEDVIVAVLSDGLGQLEHSGLAAEAITESISNYLANYNYCDLNEESFKEVVLSECKRVIYSCSDSNNISVTKMDCTLLFIVLFKDVSNYILGQLGDGAICCVKPNEGLKEVAFDDRFKLSSNLTKTILSSDARDFFNLRKYPIEDLVGFFLTTDGLENEIYSKAGNVKKKIEWYFNTISNNNKTMSDSLIQNRWDELASDEKYGFTDDMSLIAIVQKNLEIKLPDEANWLCACGYRNRMESSRCERCNKDFLKVYKGVNFKKDGGSKLAFFTQINEDIQKEFHILNEHCEYPIEFDRPIGNQGSATTQNFLEKSSRHGLFAAEKESLSTNKIGNKHHGDYVSPNAESSKEDSQKHSDNSHYRHQTET